MNKIGLCIVYKNWNYGSMLQSFATLIELRKLNVDYEILRYERKKDLSFYINSIPRLLLSDMRYSKYRNLKKKIGKKKHKSFAKNDSIRASRFESFVNRNFDNFSSVIDSYNVLQEYSRNFDAIMVGSDQLWLPSGLDTNFYNLMFVPDEIKKIAYAASFGVGEIPKIQINKTKNYLNRIDFISVREHSGQKLIKDLTGRDVPVIVDPTLVITKEDWDKNIPNIRIVDEDYIFCYFLGNNLEQRKEVEKLRANTGLKIVVLKHLDEYIASDENFGDCTLYNIGPEEFINLIRFATYVCTDSFHGSVFSIINHKQFISFNRYGDNNKNSRNSRLDSLFYQLGIERRFKGDIVKNINDIIDYVDVDKRLIKLRKYAVDFISSAIKQI